MTDDLISRQAAVDALLKAYPLLDKKHLIQTIAGVPSVRSESTQISTNIYNEEETHENCTVQILKNTITGDISVGWRKNET